MCNEKKQWKKREWCVTKEKKHKVLANTTKVKQFACCENVCVCLKIILKIYYINAVGVKINTVDNGTQI